MRRAHAYNVVLAMFLLSFCSSVLGQASSSTKEDDASCVVSKGWTYSSSSASSVSVICKQAKLPGDCIIAHPACQWCAQPDFEHERCNLHHVLKQQKCKDLQVVQSVTAIDNADNSQRFNHQRGSALIRVGDSVSFSFRIKEPQVYPVDFYYLMDVSYSMADDLGAVQNLARVLVQTLRNLTKGGTGEESVKIGFGKFVDKVQSPMTQMTPYKLIHPYRDNTDAPFLYKNVIHLTSDIAHFEEVLSHENVSGNLDAPEGALGAMLQVIQCKELIGWRGNALRLLMIATESAYHYAADGAAFLAGITKANDGKCHTTSDGIYVGAESQDYPSINQVVRALEDNSITPIFAIGKTYANLYKYLSENVFRGSAYGVLKKDSSNVVDLVRQAYLQITGKQEIVTTNPDDSILCPWYRVRVPSGQVNDLSVGGTLVENLDSGSQVYYNMSLSANRYACKGKARCQIGDMEIKTRRYDDSLRIDTSVLAAFGCTEIIQPASPLCTGRGNFTCGMCICDAGWTGADCSRVFGIEIGCIEPGSSLECSGRGRCLSGQCLCDPGYKHQKAKVFGDFCQCDECPKRAGLVCSANGNAINQDCSCSCKCAEGWSGHDCSCSVRTETCMGANGLECSGNGKCVCGSCVCKVGSGYGGPTCSDCLENCPSCGEFEDCMRCKLHNTGPLKDTCEKSCPEYDDKIAFADTNSMKDENMNTDAGEVLCAAIDDKDNCKFYYSYQPHPDGTIFVAEREKRCKPSYSLLIILWCILLFLLIGLILLCCWKCCVYVIDREEAKNYALSNIARYATPGLIPLLPAAGASSVIEFIKAKYLVRRSAKVAVIPVRRSFLMGKSVLYWRTYPGSSQDDDFEVLSQGEEGTMVRKRKNVETLVVHGKKGDSTIEIEPVEVDGNGASAAGGRVGMNGQHQQGTASTAKFETIDERMPLLDSLDWGEGSITFEEKNEFTNIEIPLLHDFESKEISFWVELYGQERGVALGLKRTKVIVIKDEEAGIIGFPKPSYVFKENDGFAVIPVHRTVGMDGNVSVSWFTRDITGLSGKHYVGGRGVIEFGDGEVTQHIQITLIPDILYDENEKAFNIMLEDPKGGASLDLSHCMVTVLGDEECGLVQFPKAEYPFTENCGVAEIAVMRTRSTKGISRVRWYTEDDTAIGGKDYETSEGIVTFEDATTESHVRIPIIDNDVYDESGRAFRVILCDPSDGTKLAHNIATVSIIEDDEPGLFEFTKTSLVMRSKLTLGRLSVIRSLGSDGHITVPWTVIKLAGHDVPSDLLAISGQLQFANGEISKTIELDLSGVTSSELLNFAVVLQEPTGGGKLGAKIEATVTVFADEDFGTVSFAQPRFDVQATAGLATLLVSRKGDVSSAAFVICETTDQSAISGTHYRGGTISVVFDAEETVKEIEIPIYNDPNHKGQLFFTAQLRSTPSGPKVTEPESTEVAITCVPLAPVILAGLAPPSGPCTIEFLKSKYLFRRSAKVAVVPVTRSSSDGSCFVQWRATGPPTSPRDLKQSRLSSASSSSSDSSLNAGDHGWDEGIVTFQDGQNSTAIELALDSRNISEAQVSVHLELVDAEWKEDSDNSLRLGLRQTEVVVLNDIDAGTLGFSKATFSFKESEGAAEIPIHRLGGMDGKVTARWRTVDDTALAGRDYQRGEGVVTFAHNQIVENIKVPLLEGDYYGEDGERKYIIQLDKLRGGAKAGLKTTTVFIVGDEDRSVVQFSKDSYPIIGNSTCVKIPVLRTGSFQRRAVVTWQTEDGTAKAGVDYAGARNMLVFEPGETKAFIEIELSGRAKEAKAFSVELENLSSEQQRGIGGDLGKVALGANKTATVSIISSQEPGCFEFSKTSFVFKTSGEVGMVPVIRSNGTDGEVSLRWIIESVGQPSPFAGAQGFLHFQDGQVSANIEIGLEGVPTDQFVLVLLPSEDGTVLGAATRANVTIIGEKEEPTIEMGDPMMSLHDPEVVEIRVLRVGNLEDATYVAWKTDDGTALNGKHFIGGSGNLVFDPNETEKKIQIPVLQSPNDEPGVFVVRLVDVRGVGKLGDGASTEVTLQPVPRVVRVQYEQAALTETIVEFLRKRYLFRQSQGSAFVPVRRSNARGMLALRWRTQPITEAEQSQVSPKSLDRDQRFISSSSESEDGQRKQDDVIMYDDTMIDWGSGTITFDDGDHEANIELVVCRDMAHRESNFRVELIDPYDRVTFEAPTTMVTVIRDKDPGMLGFASPKYSFMCSENQLVIPVHRSSGADGTVAVPWYTRDATAIGGIHYLPADGNLIFGDGEVLKKISIQMPKRVEYFDEDEVAFKLCLGEPTGGASLNVYEAHVVLQNDIVPAKISFAEPNVTCQQSRGTLQIPVHRDQDASGLATLAWQVRGLPGKPKSRYEGATGTLVFADGEAQKDIVLKLPPQVQQYTMDSFLVILEQPTSGRATLGEHSQCTAAIDNDIIPGRFRLDKEIYEFKQSEGRDVIRIVREGGSKGNVSLPWRILPGDETCPPSSMHDLHGTAEFDDGQTSADVTIPFPPDTDEDQERFVFILLPPNGRAELKAPYRADVNLDNDLKCEITFTKPEYEIRGDIDTFLLPVVRDGPKGRAAEVEYRTKDGTAQDCTHYIGGEGVLCFEPGENKKDILIPVMNDLNGGRSSFTVQLGEITGPAELGANDVTTVNIQNVAGSGKFEMASRQQKVNQSEGVVRVVVVRRNGRKGNADVSWFVERGPGTPTAPSPLQRADNYDNLEGTLTFEDGEDEKCLEIPLADKPQDDDVTNVDVTLLTPTSGAILGEVTSTRVEINNDVDGGMVQLESGNVEAFGTDGDVRIAVIRSGACTHPCQVTWEALDDTAVRGKHYRAGKGMINFEPNETRKEIIIPILNDPSGDVMHFHVALGSARGGAKLGAISRAQVMIDHVQEMTQQFELYQTDAPPVDENVHGKIGFDDPASEQLQSSGKVVLTLKRKTGTRGRVVVPWSIVSESPKSPYNDLHGQEEFKDGEDESHIEIETPEKPQRDGVENFTVLLGDPMGGAELTGDTECKVTVVNDVIPGKVSFPSEAIEAKQSEEVLKIPIIRQDRTEGKVRVPWRTSGEDMESPFSNLSGIETFENGEDTSHITIQLPKLPRDTQTDQFVVSLAPPKTSECILADPDVCKVTVLNDIAPGMISFSDTTQEALQSKGKVYLKVIRSQNTQGRVILPWKVIPESPDSVYVGATGETVLEDGEDHGMVEVGLPQLPLSNPEETVIVALEPPLANHAKLADDGMCQTRIVHDLGEGLIEMRSHEVTCNSEDGEALVAVVRKLGCDFPAEIAWVAEDGDAFLGQHFSADKGKLKFKPGESERSIHIPVVNDPSGEVRYFNVRLSGVKGRDKIGDKDVCQVNIDNEATPPNVVGDFDADLNGPHSIRTSWLPSGEGAPVNGYKVTYWSRPGTVKNVTVPAEETTAVLEDLQPNTPYQVNVRPYNSVGDGPASETLVVETQPELRLAYQTPVQVKTSQQIVDLTLKRNIKEFTDVVTWKVIREIRRKNKPASSTSSSITSDTSSADSSSDSSSGGESPAQVVSSGELEYAPGMDTATLQLPLKQDMRHSSQLYRVLVRPKKDNDEQEDEKERPLANVELNVINDTGYPGRVRKPFAASMSPHECTVSWEPPALGGPVDGYRVIAKSEDAPDVETRVGPDERKLTLSGLKSSTKYRVYVQPYNKVGNARPSSTATVVTQDEMKIEFSERFFSFKTSDKVAVIPIKRHFTRGYATLNWNVRWCKRSDLSDTSGSDSETESEVRGRDWASGSVTFPDGVESSEVRIPLQQATPAPIPRKRSFFWLHVTDPNRKKRLAAMRCKLVDDKARLVAPKNVEITVTGASSFKVNWEPQEATVHEYLVSYKRAGDSDEPRRYTVPPSEHEFQVDGLQPESAYAVVVSALGEGGQQASSDVIGCKTPGKVPGPPNRLAFQVLSPTSLHCSWGEPAETNGIITGYEVVYKPSDEEPDKQQQQPPVMVRIPDGHYRSLLVENLLEDTSYLYSVRAQNRAGTGPPRDATMKIERVGSRPPSAIFLDEENMKAIQEQIRLEEAVKKANRSISNSSREDRGDRKITTTVRHVQPQPEHESSASSATKTRVTRYIHKEGRREPEVETVEYDGRLSQEELAKLAEGSQRIEVQVISYNTSSSSTTTPSGYHEQQTSTDGTPMVQGSTSTSYMPQEYVDTDVRRDISQDTAVYTDVEETKEGDMDVTTITKTYRTTTTERRLETTSGMKTVVVGEDGQMKQLTGPNQ